MHKHRLERVLVTNKKFELKGLLLLRIYLGIEHPFAAKDDQGKLLAGLLWVYRRNGKQDRETCYGRVDVLVLDTAHGHSTEC